MLLFCTILPPIVMGEEPAVLFLSPETTKMKIGQEGHLQVKVQNARNVFGTPFYLAYPSDLIKIVRVVEGNFLKQDGKKTVFLHKVNEKGRIIFGLSRLGGVKGVGGDGLLADIWFEAVRPGKGTLSFEQVDFRDDRRAVLPVRTQSAQIEILRLAPPASPQSPTSKETVPPSPPIVKGTAPSQPPTSMEAAPPSPPTVKEIIPSQLSTPSKGAEGAAGRMGVDGDKGLNK